MENYKLVNSKEVQEKAFRLGYHWNNMGKDIVLDAPCIFVAKPHMTLGFAEDYLKSEYQEITQADFLALPEPFKKGDMIYISTTDKEQVTVCKVDKVTSKDITDTWGSIYEFADYSDIRRNNFV